MLTKFFFYPSSSCETYIFLSILVISLNGWCRLVYAISDFCVEIYDRYLNCALLVIHLSVVNILQLILSYSDSVIKASTFSMNRCMRKRIFQHISYSQLVKTNVYFFLPKFQFSSTLECRDYLANLGAKMLKNL